MSHCIYMLFYVSVGRSCDDYAGKSKICMLSQKYRLAAKIMKLIYCCLQPPSLFFFLTFFSKEAVRLCP